MELPLCLEEYEPELALTVADRRELIQRLAERGDPDHDHVEIREPEETGPLQRQEATDLPTHVAEADQEDPQLPTLSPSCSGASRRDPCPSRAPAPWRPSGRRA